MKEVNRVMESRNLHSIREMVEGFAADMLVQPALVMKNGDGYATLSYGELQDAVRSLGTALLERGMRSGDRVGLISENRSEWVITYLAVTCAGGVIVPYDILLKAEELSAIVRGGGARTVFTSAEYREKVEKAAAGLIDTVVMFDTPAGSEVSFSSLLEQGRCLRQEGRDLYRRVSVEPDSLAALIFTSGTTGTPKGVMLSHRNLVENGD
ncbi:MAG TPA: AMP-binding protein, partial [Spirochaetia bacterium]|nr:AMP-binding protein [Spirochaetia bacterium]